MICQVRGTSGSGKSWVMREVMKGLGEYETQYITGRKQPFDYFFNGLIYVLGHYESPCGGCDTIGSAGKVYEVVKRFFEGPDNARHVLCEGLLLSEDTKWTLQMPAISEVRVIFLNTDLDTCLAQIEKRRKAVGSEKPLNPKNTANRVATIERARVRLTEAGIYCRRASASQAPGLILDWLGK